MERIEASTGHPELSIELTDQIVRLLVEAAQPTRIILFGSYARGMQHPHSDVDLVVIEHALARRPDWQVGFFCQQAVEKMLKAVLVSKTPMAAGK